MKVTLGKEALSTALRKVLNAVNTRSTIPVLNNVLLESDGDKLTLAATDLEVYLKATVEAKVERPGRTTLPARKFGQIVSALPDGDVVLDTDDDQHTSISCNKSFFKILGLDPADFPEEGEADSTWSFALPANELRQTLGKVSYSASTDETRHVLNGVLMSIRTGILTTVATDGRRLALVERPLDGDGNEDCDVILPPKVVGELVKVLEGDEPVNVALSEARASFSTESVMVTTKLVEGSYPNYRQVIPGSFSHSAVMPRETMAVVLNRVAMVVSESSASVLLKLDKAQVTLSAMSTEVGEGSEPFEASYDGEPLEIAFNPTFLMDPLKHLVSDQIVLQFNDQYSPMSISGDEGFLYVIMPMRS